MQEVTGNIWKLEGDWIVIPTNGFVKTNGECVMGRGLAYQANKKYSNLSYLLGSLIKVEGNHVHLFKYFHLITFPVKHNWWEDADLDLIDLSCQNLLELANDELLTKTRILVPRVGCGNGKLLWSVVKPILEKYFTDDRFIVVSMPGDE